MGLCIPARQRSSDTTSLLEHTIHKLHPYVAFLILPMFAFVNSGIALEGMNLIRLFEPIPIGIMLGLAVGKPLGVMVMLGLTVVMANLKLPTGVTWRHLWGVAFLCGVGFTMSIFVGSLAFQEADIGYARIDRLAIILASLSSACIGYVILRFGITRSPS